MIVIINRNATDEQVRDVMKQLADLGYMRKKHVLGGMVMISGTDHGGKSSDIGVLEKMPGVSGVCLDLEIREATKRGSG